jgi:hypothetical protein
MAGFLLQKQKQGPYHRSINKDLTTVRTVQKQGPYHRSINKDLTTVRAVQKVPNSRIEYVQGHQRNMTATLHTVSQTTVVSIAHGFSSHGHINQF